MTFSGVAATPAVHSQQMQRGHKPEEISDAQSERHLDRLEYDWGAVLEMFREVAISLQTGHLCGNL